MNTVKNSKKNIVLVSLLFGLLFVYLLILNYKTPLMGEDYKLMILDSSITTSFSHWFKSIVSRINEQLQWNVRLGDQLSIIFLSLNINIFKILNTILQMYFFVLLFFWGNGRLPKSKLDFLSLSVTSVMFFFICSPFDEIFFWLTGSCNYLWTLCILLSCAIPIRLYLVKFDFNIKNNVLVFLYCFLCLFAGLTNENTVPFIIALGVFLIIFTKMKKMKTPKWLCLSTVSYFLGWLYLVGCTSTKNRTQYYRTAYGLSENITIQELLKNSKRVIDSFLDQCSLLFLGMTVILVVFVIVKAYNQKRNKESFGTNVFLIVVSSVSIVALAVAPYTEARSFFLFQSIGLGFISYLLVQSFSSIHINKKNRIITGFLLGVFYLGTILFFSYLFHLFNQYYIFDKSRSESIRDHVSEGNRFAVAQLYPKRSRFLNTHEEYISITPPNGGSVPYANYHGAEQVFWSDVEDSNIKNVLWEQLPIASKYEEGNDFIWSISTINDSIINENEYLYTKRNDEPLEVSGYFFKKDRSVPQNICIKIGDEYFNVKKYHRQDVADVFQNSELVNTGFYLASPLTNIPKGDYNITICTLSQEGTSRIEIDTNLVLKVK